MDNTLSLNHLPITTLKGVGPRLSEKLSKLGIETVQDLLFHLPRGYQDRTRLIPLGSIKPGNQIAIEGKIELTEEVFRSRRQLLCRLSDGTGFLTLRFFHFNPAQKNLLSKGHVIRCFGEVHFGPTGYEMIHPEFHLAKKETPLEIHLTPIYPTTEGLHQIALRKMMNQALDLLQEGALLEELLPDEILDQYHFNPLKEALFALHRPLAETKDAINRDAINRVSTKDRYLVDTKVRRAMPAVMHQTNQNPIDRHRLRLAFEELLAYRLSLLTSRSKTKRDAAYSLTPKTPIIKAFLEQLPFELTRAQIRVFKEIKNDLANNHPMMRLLQGDVGSGKTVIAALAALLSADNGYQTAIMAPTEILAEQHFKIFSRWLNGMNVEIERLSSATTGKERKRILDNLSSGKTNIIVGTHALFQDDVIFKNLALVIIDEQHRFGVHQRLALLNKGKTEHQTPHQLIMTATPIPRTLAMSAYADLDHSIIDELPKGRKPIETVMIDSHRRLEMIERIRLACQKKQQAYWVCTLIDESDVLQCQAAEKTAEELHVILSELKIGLVHGRMKAKEKDTIMQAFKGGEIDLLVATTVIEVGVDIPNASLMIIENPERLGLAQLHQLRGRVGRGNQQSYCVLLYQKPLSDLARERLSIMRETNDGFKIAQKDLEIRGPGELLGPQQAGIVNMRIADILRDQGLLNDVQYAADKLFQDHFERTQKLIRRWVNFEKEYISA